ncbi:group I intron endonuclease [Methanobrevibacter gottschalkii]|uniref:Group I intron endonuclease n=1 Tax=Methanobrevibacter gottschalkii TaxID=190974 RepID=A0A1H7LEF2_9EURY|nr:GIY-YIG nuclease family protein [Methanobrevibacter gottschalkii]SEK97372.1 group I intron endonuclease [Methanobrevibacter gottschalkii]
MVCGIYLITRKDTSQKYVGKSNDIKRRWQQHIGGYDKRHSWIDNAIRKHGADKFILQIITELPDDEKVLLQHEKYWIKFYNAYEDKNHYNLTPGGDFNPMLVPDIVEKISGENNYWHGRKNPELSERNYKRTGEKNPNWGTSFVEEWGGFWFLKAMASLDITIYELVKYTGLSRSSIQVYLRTRGYTWTQLKEEATGTKKYSIDDYGGLNFLRDCIKAGKTRVEVSKEIGISPQTITDYLSKRGYNWTRLKEEVTGTKKYSIDDYGGLEFLQDCVRDGKTQNDIGKETGISEKTIRSYLNKNGYSWEEFIEEVTGTKKYSIDDYGGIDFIKECIKEGKDQKDIAKEINISVTTIRKYLKRQGYTWAQLKKEVDGNIRHSIIDDFGGINFLIDCIKAGKTQTDVAKEMGIASDTIWKYLKRRGFSWTKLEEKAGRKRYSIDELGGLDYLINCIKEGKTQTDVAKELGISPSSDVIWRYLKSKGYTWTQLKKEVIMD